MAYLALARKWRPKSFGEVVGQNHVVKALSNALDSGRVHHAYLFTGTRGVGKTTLARIFAKSLNCETGTSAEPCQQCSMCLSVDEGRFVDLIEVDAASRTKVDDTRELLDNVQYAPTSGQYKVYLIDEVHMLSGHSFNALLKTLEEPPEHVKFLFATTDPQKLPVTVLSRCLQFNLRAMRPEQVENQLIKILEHEDIEFELSAVQALAKAADGSMRDGLSLLDQAIAQSNGNIAQAEVASMLGTIKAQHSDALMAALFSQDARAVMQVVADMADHAVDFSAALDELLVRLYDISLVQMAPNAAEEKGLNVNDIQAQIDSIKPEQIQLYYQIGLKSKQDLVAAPSLRVGFEMALLRMLVFAPDGTPTADTPSAPLAETAPVTQTAPEIEVHSNTPQEPVQGSKATNVQQREQTTATGPDITGKISGEITPSVEPPVEPPVGEKSVSSSTPVLAEHNEWGGLVEQSNLIGMTRQLAMNCACERLLDERIELCLAPTLQHLHKPERIQEIETEMQRLLNSSVAVTVSTENSDKETPAECLERLGIERTSQIKADIEQQPGVKALMSEFGASIVEQSIKPAES